MNCFQAILSGIDDIGFWNRKLSDSEILDLYNALENSTDIVSGQKTFFDFYPNPSSHSINLNFNPSTIYKGHKVCIMNMMSQVIFQRDVTQESEKIELNESLENGIYSLMLLDSENRIVGSYRLILIGR